MGCESCCQSRHKSRRSENGSRQINCGSHGFIVGGDWLKHLATADSGLCCLISPLQGRSRQTPHEAG
ncbi:hypothetical protein V2G26_019491 [Clonostachys chloroleuca]